MGSSGILRNIFIWLWERVVLQVVADFCAWSGMRIKREKSVATGFDYQKDVALSTEGILYAGGPLTGLAAEVAFAYLRLCRERPKLVNPLTD